jgi:predicted acylesterase/phospholipase RssA
MIDNFDHIHYFCFGGGGGHGMMYIGAIEALLRKTSLNLNQIQGCIGTSAGALTAFSIVAGLTYEKTLNLALKYDHVNIAPKMDVALLVNHYGMDEGNSLMEIIVGTIEAAGMSSSITLADLYRITKRHFVCVVSNLDTRQPVYMDHVSFPDMEAKMAIRISMGLPLIFAPCRVNETFYIDGCLTANYPIDFFPVEQTLIFSILQEHETVRTWKEYGISVLQCGQDAQKKEIVRRLHEKGLQEHLFDLHKPAFDIKLTEIRRDVAVFGFYHMLLKVCPEISVALESIVLIIIVRFLKILNTREDIPLYNEVFSECEKRLLEV